MFSLSQFDLTTFIVQLSVLLLAMPVHEFAHAAMAVRLGDDTPIKQGRYTLDPLSHLSLIGSLALFLFGFGWAKPVAVSNRAFKHPRRDMALVALMGPVANILFALVLMIIYKFMFGLAPGVWRTQINIIFSTAISLNLTLAAFNLLPIPPLDGSRILDAALPARASFFLARHEGAVTVILLVLMYTGVLTIPLTLLTNLLWDFLFFATIPIDKIVGLLQ